MVSSDFRKEAREKLTGKWGKAACITLVYCILSSVITLLQEYTTGLPNMIVIILELLIEVPLNLGLATCFVKLFNDENVNAFDFFSHGFNNFGKSWGIALRTLLKLILPIILFIVSFVLIIAGSISIKISLFASEVSRSGMIMSLVGYVLLITSYIYLIVKSFYYSLTYIISADNPELSSKDVVEKSKELMQNNRFKLFCLGFSFIGWILLSIFSLGISTFWVIPYMQFAYISFYKHSIKK